MGSSLIYVAIVAMWAGLLIPMWLRRHEQETEVRSVDRFSTAMRILSRRPTPPPDRRYLVMPQRPPAATAPLADVPRAAVRRHIPAAAPAPRSRPVPRKAGRGRLIARRRRLLFGLLAVAFLTFVLALAGVLSWWWQFVADLAFAAYVLHLRAEAKRARVIERHRQARAAAQPAPAWATAAAEPVEAVDVPVRPRAPQPQAAPVASPVASGPLVIDEETWEPVPVPLPTYVTASVAERPEPAPIPDEREPLFDQEQWHDDEEFAGFADVDDDELAQIVGRRRAVGD